MSSSAPTEMEMEMELDGRPTAQADAVSTKSREILVFLCYRRNDGSWYADWIDRALNGCSWIAADGSLCRIRTYYDRATPAVPDWKAHHFPALQSAHAFMVICTPGVAKDLSRPGHPDWVYEEIRWWLKEKSIAPILIETTGEDDRWLPDPIRSRWQSANRLELSRAELEAAAAADQAYYLERWRERVVRSVRDSDYATTVFEAARLKVLNRRLKASLVALGAAIMATVVFAGIARTNALDATREAESAKAAIDFLTESFAKADPDRTFGKTLTATQILHTGAAMIDSSSLSDQAELRILRAIGTAYTGLGEYERSLQLLQEAERLVSQQTSAQELARLKLALGEAHLYTEEYERAEAPLLEAQRLIDEQEDPIPADRSAVLVALGDRFAWPPEPDFAKASQFYTQALAIDEEATAHIDIARDHGRLAYLSYLQGEDTRASVGYRRAIEIAERAPGATGALAAAQHEHDFAAVLYELGQYEEARRIFSGARQTFASVYGRNSIDVANIENNLGRILIEVGRIEEARPLLVHAVDVQQDELGQDFYQLAFSANNLALTEIALGDLATAREHLRKARAVAHKNKLAIEGQALVHEAETYLAESDYVTAAGLLADAHRVFETAEPGDWRVAIYESARGELEAMLCNPTKALELLERSAQVLAERWPNISNVFTNNAHRRRELLKESSLRNRCSIASRRSS